MENEIAIIESRMSQAITDNELVNLSQKINEYSNKALSLAKSVDEKLEILRQSKVFQDYVRLRIRDKESAVIAQNEFAEINLRAQRDIGGWLKENARDKGERDEKIQISSPVIFEKPKLSDLGISLNQSSAWQKIADIPEEVFERHIAETKDSKEELTTSSTLRLADSQIRKERDEKEKQMKETLEPSPFPHKRYSVIVVDPPWELKKIIRKVRPNQKEFDYPTLTIDEIKSLPISDLANNVCTLFLWTIDKYLYQAKEILENWGFQYHLTMAWDKGNGMAMYGFYRQTEFVLVGFRGTHEAYPERKTIRTSFTGKPEFHSAKPDEFYDMLKVLDGNKIDIFARKQRVGFDVYGNEVL